MDAMIGDNIPALVKQGLAAVEDYTAAMREEGAGQQHAIRAAVAYGEALLLGREAHASGKFFTAWVHDNQLDVEFPWDRRHQRTAAMGIARIVRKDGLSAFAECSRSLPSDIMAWHRRQHPPQPKTEGQLRTEEAARAGKAHQKAAGAAQSELALTTDENQQLAEAPFSAKSKMTIKKAIGIYKKRLDKSFYNAVSERVRAEIAAADNHVRKAYDELRPKYVMLESRFADLQRARGVFTRAEFRQLLMCCHPDASAGPEIRAKLTNLLVRNENRLLKEE